MLDRIIRQGQDGYRSAPVDVIRADGGALDRALFVVLSAPTIKHVGTILAHCRAMGARVQACRAASKEDAVAYCRFMVDDVLPGGYVLVDPEPDSWWPTRERFYSARRPHIRISKSKMRKNPDCYPPVG